VKFWGGLAVWVLGLAVAASVVAWVTDAKLLEPQPLLQSVPATTYSGLANGFPAALSKVVSLTPDDQALVAQFVDATWLKQLTDQVVTAELGYLHGQSAAPTIDLQPLLDRLNAGGATVPPQLASYLSQPQPIAATPVAGPLRTEVHAVDALRWLGPLLAMVLVGVICLTAGHHRLRSLAKGLLIAAVCLGLVWLWDLVTPTLIGTGLGASPLKPLATPIGQALTGPFQSANHLYIVAIIILLAIALVLAVAETLVHHHNAPVQPAPKPTKSPKL